MKSFHEWQEEETRDENPALLLSNINKLATILADSLKNYQGERFEGFIEMIGASNSLTKTLAEIDTNCFSPKWLTSESDGDGQPDKPQGMKKINYQEKKSKGTRDLRNDLSKDYKGHVGRNGTVEPLEKVK
jgi:hypothetical protein